MSRHSPVHNFNAYAGPFVTWQSISDNGFREQRMNNLHIFHQHCVQEQAPLPLHNSNWSFRETTNLRYTPEATQIQTLIAHVQHVDRTPLQSSTTIFNNSASQHQDKHRHQRGRKRIPTQPSSLQQPTSNNLWTTSPSFSQCISKLLIMDAWYKVGNLMRVPVEVSLRDQSHVKCGGWQHVKEARPQE